jgi:hypothetical protein
MSERSEFIVRPCERQRAGRGWGPGAQPLGMGMSERSEFIVRPCERQRAGRGWGPGAQPLEVGS